MVAAAARTATPHSPSVRHGCDADTRASLRVRSFTEPNEGYTAGVTGQGRAAS